MVGIGNTLTTALSGLQSNSLRVNVAANNIANLNSRAFNPITGARADDFTPQTVTQTALANGGVQARATSISPPSRGIADNNAANGVGFIPNLNLETQLVELIQARIGYQANAAVVRTSNDLTGKLLDTFS